MDKVEKLLGMAYAMHGGDAMLRRYAARQGWRRDEQHSDVEALINAAWHVVSDGRGWGDVLRAAS